MSIIKVENLTFSYPNGYENVFEEASFQIDTDWKLGFVGRNGRGKTTFLNLLLGKYEYSGKIISSVSFDYFPYRIAHPENMTEDLLLEICPAAEEWELMRELSYLDLDAEILYRPFQTLSHGEQTKALLAALFLNEDHFLLIDEPTNHLDTDGRQTVADYLKRKKGFILVSHDRRFLDECTDHTLSLNRQTIEVQSGNFSSWMENFEAKQNAELERNEKLKKDIGRLKEAARRTSVWSDRVEASKRGAYDKGFVGHKSAKMMKRAKSIEARQQKAIEEKSGLLKNQESTEPLSIFTLEYHRDLLASFQDVSISYDGKTVCGPVSFEIHQKDRIFLEGKNGSGKSSLLKLLNGEAIEHTGKVEMPSGLIISYVPQDTSFLKGSLSGLVRDSDLDDHRFKAILRKMDFERGQFDRNMEVFSEGQKKKVLIAKSLCEKAHLYVWDEPLNYLDIYTRMQIEQLISEFEPPMLLVEHDAAFREKIATERIVL